MTVPARQLHHAFAPSLRRPAVQPSPQSPPITLWHDDHLDILVDGVLWHVSGSSLEPHTLEVEPGIGRCTPEHECGGHAAEHVHGPGCGHPMVPHGDHMDYLVGSHLHHVHDGHCDHHGTVRLGHVDPWEVG